MDSLVLRAFFFPFFLSDRILVSLGSHGYQPKTTFPNYLCSQGLASVTRFRANEMGRSWLGLLKTESLFSFVLPTAWNSIRSPVPALLMEQEITWRLEINDIFEKQKDLGLTWELLSWSCTSTWSAFAEEQYICLSCLITIFV